MPKSIMERVTDLETKANVAETKGNRNNGAPGDK